MGQWYHAVSVVSAIFAARSPLASMNVLAGIHLLSFPGIYRTIAFSKIDFPARRFWR